jgi:hypothetical protein
LHPDLPGFTAQTLELRDELRRPVRPLAKLDLGDMSIEARPGRDTLWLIVRRAGKGGFALRTARSTGPLSFSGRRTKAGGTWRVESSSGLSTVKVTVLGPDLLRVTVSLRPAADLLLPFWPRDLYPLDGSDDPTRAKGWVEAGQRGLNTGLCYFCLNKPAFGSVLYVQNFSALNPYFAATETKPDGVVGGEWPELGYQPPTSPIGNSPPTHPLAKGEEVVISDAFLALTDSCIAGEAKSAGQFIEMLAKIYPHLDKPEPQFHDWFERSQRTLRDLAHAPEATIEHYGHRYIHPYTASEYPDSMVQASIVAAMREYGDAFKADLPLAEILSGGMSRFFDKELGTIRRYLPNVGKDKDKNAVDSWYLYHPLMSLARLARSGDEAARKLFLESLDFGIKAARHFKYVWPIQYNVENFSVITPSRNEQGLGQTDVGGLYAYVMMQAYELTEDETYLSEARAALKALKDMRFELAYQTNLTAWGAVACLRLWRLEKDPEVLARSQTFIASFLHNCALWNSELGHAKAYTNFFGVTCLHDAPYMAAYECFESFAAFDEYLRLADEHTPASVRLLLSEYRRYALDVTWWFYPDALSEDAIAKDDIRNGHIDRKLSFPLEDLYNDGQPAGKVGQEIYGAGGAFQFAARAFHVCGDAPFRLFVDHLAEIQFSEEGALIVRLRGLPGSKARLRLLRKERRTLPRISVVGEDSRSPVSARARTADFRDYLVDADRSFRISWRQT